MSIAITLSGIALASLAAAFGVMVLAIAISEIIRSRKDKKEDILDVHGE